MQIYVYFLLEIKQKHNVVCPNNGLNISGTHTCQTFTNMLKSQLMANSSPRNDGSQKTEIKIEV